MVFIPRDAKNEQVLNIVREWVDVLVNEEYEKIFISLGYSMCYGRDGAEAIQMDIKNYRSPEFYPNIEDFTVTDWRAAYGGNTTPVREVIWYKPNDTKLRGAVAFDLPLNGQWSDLQADFVFMENDHASQGYILCLEDISCFAQRQRKMEEMETQ